MLCKVKKGKRQLWENWCLELATTHKEESILSLVEEDLIRERCIIFEIGDDSYVLYEHQSLEGKEKKPYNPNRELNQKHNRIFHECLERVKETPVIGYDLQVGER